MTQQHPPYPPPYPPPGRPGPPTNGFAVAALVLGMVGLILTPVPLLNLLGVLAGAVGLGLGLAALRRARRSGTGTGMARVGVGMAVVAIVLSLLWSWYVWLWLGDALDWVDPPEASVQVGEEFETDEGHLRIRVTRAECTSTNGRDVACTYRFVARNLTDNPITLGDIEVKSVINREFHRTRLDGETRIGPGQQEAIRGSVSTYGPGPLEGIAFDGTDASSRKAVVVDLSAAWEEARSGK